nr:MAG TPA: hypothetical protein [Caudoviricetes sp.]
MIDLLAFLKVYSLSYLFEVSLNNQIYENYHRLWKSYDN